jgi:hypothetical protein
VAAFYIDKDVDVSLVPALVVLGHQATTTDELGFDQASDGRQLLAAAEHGWVLVTHNRRDFIVLHDAWRFWTATWGITLDHAGIVVLPRSVHGRTWLAAYAAERVDDLLRSDQFAAGQLFTWSRTNGVRERERGNLDRQLAAPAVSRASISSALAPK